MQIKLRRREVQSIIDALLCYLIVQGLLMVAIVVLLIGQYKTVIGFIANQKPGICIQVGDDFKSVTVEEIINE